MIHGNPSAILRILEVREIRSAISSLGREIKSGMWIAVDEQCTPHSVLGPNNLDYRRPIAIDNIGDVVDLHSINDRTRRPREIYSIEVSCLALVFKEGAVTFVGRILRDDCWGTDC